MFFDEADALFGRRTEGSTGRERDANIEINFLLQCIESYKGMVILSTNMKHAIDEAFINGRIKYFVEFGYPPIESRERIWERAFPANVNIQFLDIKRLAKINLNGRMIRNTSLLAQILASDESTWPS